MLGIQIRTKLKGRIRIRIQISDKLDPDPHCIKVINWIRIRILINSDEHV
jgi:hypothetical protein